MTRVQQFALSVDLLQALLWQHNSAPRIETLMRNKDAWFRRAQADFWAEWLRDVFDLRTANAFGRQVWARILGIRLSIPTGASNLGKPTWGVGALNQNFGHGNYNRLSAGSVSLTAEEQRIVLQLRYFQLITRCAIPEINRMLVRVFGAHGHVYALDSNDMEWITYVFDFDPGSQMRLILDTYDLLPRPAAVGVRYTVLSDTGERFGFGEFNENFRLANFTETSEIDEPDLL